MAAVSANRRDVLVAVVAAAFGGSVVAGAFAASSYLRQNSRSHSNWRNDSIAFLDNADTNFLLSWIRHVFNRVSLMLVSTALFEP
jgi:hypothetical protein